MIIECHSPSPQPKCISIPICHPIVKCCNCTTKCICIKECCSQSPCTNCQTENCEDSKQIFTSSTRIPQTPYLNIPKTHQYTQYLRRNNTPDITKIYSKTNSYFNNDESYIYNNQKPLNQNNLNDDPNDNIMNVNTNLSITRNNSINYTNRKKLNNNIPEYFINKQDINRKNNLLDKIQSISYRLDKTINQYNNNNKKLEDISKDKINRTNINRYYSNDNINYINKRRKSRTKNMNKYMDEIN